MEKLLTEESVNKQLLDAFKEFAGINRGIVRWNYLIWRKLDSGIPNSVIEINDNGRPKHDISIYDIKEVTCELGGPIKHDKIRIVGLDGNVLFEGQFDEKYLISKSFDKDCFPNSSYNENTVATINKYVALYKQFNLDKGETVFNKNIVVKLFD